MQKDKYDFTIYVVGGMATGKSTLINTMIGRKLMPYDYDSHSFVCVEHANTIDFQGVAYDVSKQELIRDEHLTYHTLQEWNNDEKISSVIVKGRIPFVNSLGVNVRIVEVPFSYKSKEYLEFLQNIDSELSLVVILSSADRLGSDVENDFIEHIYNITRDDTQFCERLIFVMNRVDTFNPEEEDLYSVLNRYKFFLEAKGFQNTHIFPVSAQTAFEARTRPLIELILPIFRQYIKHFPSTHLDSFYNFTHLPDYIRLEIEYDLIMAKNNPNKKEGEYAAIEIHSGIVSLEKAITLYLNKYINNSF